MKQIAAHRMKIAIKSLLDSFIWQFILIFLGGSLKKN